MKVVMLAAGLGSRLGQASAEIGPKVLMQFGGKSLLERHIDICKAQGISELVLGVGFQHAKIQHEIERLGAESFVRTFFNKDFEQGNIVLCQYFAMSFVAASLLFSWTPTFYMTKVCWKVLSNLSIPIVYFSTDLLNLPTSQLKYVYVKVTSSSFVNG